MAKPKKRRRRKKGADDQVSIMKSVRKKQPPKTRAFKRDDVYDRKDKSWREVDSESDE